MRDLYEHLRARNPRGLPRDDAVQLFIWLFCSSSILPVSLRHERITKDVLVDVFERLECDNLIFPRSSPESLVDWSDLVSSFLLGRIDFDLASEERISRYL